MADPEVPPGDASLMARMLDLQSDSSAFWSPEDLGAIYEHQLSASLEVDLRSLRPDVARYVAELGAAGGPPIATFHDLFNHPEPPLDLLELTKQFAKNCRGNPDGPLPDEVATVLYVAAIAVAMVRRKTRITKLDDAGMRHGLHWALRQSWLDASTRRLLEEGCEAFGGSASA
jgi:hypothetical protein